MNILDLKISEEQNFRPAIDFFEMNSALKKFQA